MFLKPSRKNSLDFIENTDKTDTSFNLRWKSLLLYLAALSVFVFLFLSLFQLQIIEGSQNLLLATRTNQSTVRVIPPRGLIYDENGRKLAYNVPAYSVYVKPGEIKKEEEELLLTSLAAVLEVDSSELIATFKSKVYTVTAEGKAVIRKTSERVTLKSDLSFDQYLPLLTVLEQFPGVYVSVEPVREYIESVYFSHILGYVGDPDQSDLDRGINPESRVGKTGVEKSYDNYLRGTEGLQVKEKEAFSGTENIFTAASAKSGDNIILSINQDWQKKLQDIMFSQLNSVGAFASSGVIMNSRTGEIKTMVSIPSYDNNLFSKGISARDYNSLIADVKQPLFNRSIALQLPPGSVWKIIGATAGLESGVVNTGTKKFSNRCMDLPGDIKFCEADAGYLGWVNISDALSKSSNIYFCQLALDLQYQRKGIYTLKEYADLYGLGQVTGIDIPGEGKGTMASPELKKQLYNEPWYLGDLCNTIIGQGLVTVTPLQMTVVASAIVNGGNRVTPRLVKRVEDQSGEIVQEFSPEVQSLNISEKTLKIIRDAMREAARSGTAGILKDSPGNIIAKTGSSDAGQYINGKYFSGAHSWIVGCFDYQGENYCYTIMQQWGGRGYKTVPIIKKFINCLYSGFASSCENV